MDEEKQRHVKVEKFRMEEYPLTRDTTCGVGFLRGPFLQRFATRTAYVAFYGTLGLITSTAWSYTNATISTMEKRFKIPSKITGIILSGCDISGFFASITLSYWAGKGHRPRWIGLSSCAKILQMLLTALPHFIYGAGEDALNLTVEYGGGLNATTIDPLEQNRKALCGADQSCIDDTGSFVQPAILFLGQFIEGIGGGLYYTIGMAYMDDNVPKAESPILISISFLIRMVGPTLGYALATLCLKFYISPTLTPTITESDPRWLGAWWLGWVIIAAGTALFTVPIFLYPKILPETEAKRALKEDDENVNEDSNASLGDLFRTMRRLLSNKIYFCNCAASIFYILGEMPYWIYIAKYLEVQYRQTPSAASFVSGTLGLVCSSVGIIISGIVIGKLKPSARTLAGWNIIVALTTVCGFISYIFVVCDGTSSMLTKTLRGDEMNSTLQCNVHCGCDYMPYSPVCSSSGETYISACHAGCSGVGYSNGSAVYNDCSCVDDTSMPHTATPDSCFVDCSSAFHMFLIIIATLKTIDATGISSNFLVGVRCVEEKDKSVSLGLSLTLMSAFAFTPSPILYGFIMDSTCLVWGQTCSGTGNCWVYDGPLLAYYMNLTAASFVFIGSLFDMTVWYHSKNLVIFD